MKSRKTALQWLLNKSFVSMNIFSVHFLASEEQVWRWCRAGCISNTIHASWLFFRVAKPGSIFFRIRAKVAVYKRLFWATVLPTEISSFSADVGELSAEKSEHLRAPVRATGLPLAPANQTHTDERAACLAAKASSEHATRFPVNPATFSYRVLWARQPRGFFFPSLTWNS